MLTMKNILREGNSKLRLKSILVKTPLSSIDKKTLMNMLSFVIASQDEELSEKLSLRPAVGLAAPQIGILKRMFVIVAYDFNGELFVLPLINPKILSHSKEIIYLPGGEGCLSVDRKTEGITPRYQTIEIEALKYNYQNDTFEEIKTTYIDYISIVFQHELDHLNGILFVDKMYENLENAKPLKYKEEEKI